MSYFEILLLQIGIALLTGFVVVLYLRGIMLRLLAEICGTHDRALFWVRVTSVTTVSLPLVLVLLFGRSAASCAEIEGQAAGEIVRQAMSISLLGALTSVALLARTVWKQVPTSGVPRTEKGVS